MAKFVLYLIAITPVFCHIIDIVRIADTHTHISVHIYTYIYTHTHTHTHIHTYPRMYIIH